jgi:hypothetical protein
VTAVRLLPGFDSTLLCHRDRALTVAPEHERTVLPGGGMARATVMVDGVVAGTWKLGPGRPEVIMFEAPAAGLAEAIEAEIADVVRHKAS